MKFTGLDVVANVSTLFTEMPYSKRFDCAARVGFNYVETWWPFHDPQPSRDAVQQFIQVVHESNVELIAMNFYAGNMLAGERGVASLPDRADELIGSLPTVRIIAMATGCRRFNLLYGLYDDDADMERVSLQDEIAKSSYLRAIDSVSHFDGVILIEALAGSRPNGYRFRTHEDVLSFLGNELEDSPACGLLLDTYHLTENGIDPTLALLAAHDNVRHVQVADSPGRHEPGSGDIDWGRFFRALGGVDYQGFLSAEYFPTRDTAESLKWLGVT